MKISDPQAAWYWPETSKLHSSSTVLSGKHEADVVVIGAGYTGLSCGLHCAVEGLQTIVLEAYGPGSGGSGRNAGQWLPGWASKQPDQVLGILGDGGGSKANRFMPDAINLVRSLVKTHEEEIDFRQCGVLQLARKKNQVDKLFALADQWTAYGLKVERHDQKSVSNLILTEDYVGGIRFCEAGTLNPYAYSNHLANMAQQAGAGLYCYSPATSIARDGAVWSVKTSSAVVSARSVIIATNAYTPAGLWPGLEKSYYSLHLPMLASTPLSNKGESFLPQGTPFTELTIAGLFGGMLTPDNRWLASSLPLPGYDADINEIGQWALSRFRQTFPGAEKFNWDQLWWGEIALTGDGLPKMVRLADNAYTAFGYSGAGIVLASGLGRELAKIVLAKDERASLFPISSLKRVAMPKFVPWLARQVLIPGMRQIEKVIA